MTADGILTVHPIEIFYAREQQKSRQESSVVSRPAFRPAARRADPRHATHGHGGDLRTGPKEHAVVEPPCRPHETGRVASLSPQRIAWSPPRPAETVAGETSIAITANAAEFFRRVS